MTTIVHDDEPAEIVELGLTERQKLFCLEFLKDLNATQAMIRAGYSENSADKKQSELTSNEKIQKYINWLRQKRQDKTGVTVDEIVRRLVRIADKAERDDEYTAALRALELLGRHQAMFTDKQVIQNADNPWATGDDEQSIADDIKRLRRAAAPKLKVVDGGKD